MGARASSCYFAYDTVVFIDEESREKVWGFVGEWEKRMYLGKPLWFAYN